MKKTEKIGIVYYVFECGCTYPVLECEKEFNVLKQNYIYVCPEHGDAPVSKFMYCLECGKKVESKGLSGIAKQRCNECNRKIYNEKRRKIREKTHIVYYEFPCGCVKTKNDDMKYKYMPSTGVGKGKKGWCCIEHNTQAIKRYIFCVKCNKKIYIGLRGKANFLCADCAKKERQKRQRAYVARKKSQKIVKGKKPKKWLRKIEKPKNIFNCSEFEMCGLCIKPYFPCRVFTAQLRRKNV